MFYGNLPKTHIYYAIRNIFYEKVYHFLNVNERKTKTDNTLQRK